MSPIIDSLGIVVLNYRNADFTIACIDSILALDERPCALCLIENGSGDHSWDRLYERYNGYQWITLMRLPYNTGYAAGNNIGIRHLLRQDVGAVCLLNNDTIVQQGFVTALLACLNSKYQADVVTPKILSRDGKTIWSAGEIANYALLSSRPSWKNQDIRYRAARRINCVTGCSMVIKSDVFKKIGMLDESYFAYVEDVDFCKRSHEAGLRFALCEDAVVIHKIASTVGNQTPAQLYLRSRNRFYFTRKNIRMPLCVLSYGWYFAITASWLVRSALRGDRKSMQAIVAGFIDCTANRMGKGRLAAFHRTGNHL